MLIMQRQKKLLVCCALVLSLIASGCSLKKEGGVSAVNTSKDTSTGTVSETGKVKLTIAYGKDARSLPASEMMFESKYNEKMGIEVEYIAIPNESLTEKKNLMLASGDLPDIFMGVITRDDIMKYKDQGIFVAVDDLVEENMPLLKGIYEKRPEYKKEAITPDGKMYGFPYIEEMNGLVANQGILSINKAWLDKLGLEMPKTLDEFKNVLIQFRDKDPNGNGIQDEIPFTTGGKDAASGLNSWANGNDFGQLMGCFGQANTGDWLAVKDSKVVTTATSESIKRGYTYLHEMYKEGLIDPEIFNNDRAMLDTKLRNEEPIVGSLITFSIADHLSAERRKDYVAVPYLQGPDGEYGCRDNISEMRPTAFVITYKCKDPEAAAKYADGLYDPQTSVEANWGPLDYVYKLDENGQMVWDTLKDGLDTFDDMRAVHSLTGNHPLAILNEYYGDVVEYPQNAKDLYDDMKTVGFVDKHLNDEYLSPLWFTPEQNEKISILATQIYGVIDTTRRKWIMDGDIDKGWDNYLKLLDDNGLEEFLSVLQEAYDSSK